VKKVEGVQKLSHVTLAFDGLNEVDIPRGGQIVSVVAAGAGMEAAVLAVMHDRDAAMEKREFFTMGAPTSLEGRAFAVKSYVGFAQYPQQFPIHVFEVTSRGGE
jgi:hypothetical protein